MLFGHAGEEEQKNRARQERRQELPELAPVDDLALMSTKSLSEMDKHCLLLAHRVVRDGATFRSLLEQFVHQLNDNPAEPD